MTFAENAGEDPTQVAGEASIEDLRAAEVKTDGDNVDIGGGVGEKAIKTVAVARAVSEGGVKAIGEKIMTTITEKATEALGGNVSAAASGSISGIAGGGIVPGVASGSIGGIIPGGIGGIVPGAAGGSIGALAGSKVPGIVSDQELPIFEEKAITSFTGGKTDGIIAKAAGAIASQLGAKNLELEVASGDDLDVRDFSVQERLSSLFQVTLTAVSDNPSIDFDAVVGQPARFALHAGAHDRFWSGLCSHLEQVRVEPSGLSTYQLSIVPTLWLLTQRKNYRMFQQISEPDIVLKVLKEWNIEPDVRVDRSVYKKRKYRVQYAESDFDFISRMLEDAGIAYFFEQVGDETTVVLSEAPHTNPTRAFPLTFLNDTSATQKNSVEFVTGVRMGQRVRPGKYTLRDHDYRRPPSYKLMSSASGGRGIEDKLERYDYTPGAFLFGTDQGDATPVSDDRGKTRTDEKEAAILAQKRLDAKRGSARVCTFETNAHDLAPGVVMSIAGHPHEAIGEGRTLLIVESTMKGTALGEWSHRCEARGTNVPFRPEVVTPKPKVNGVESATVVGPAKEEIHTDEFGRVRVHFHWDRESQMDERSSCWIHVSQTWAGSGYGGMNLPRIGQEVLVDFLGGDPDRPIIVGRVYTNLQKVPYKLPANKTQSGWKSNATGGGGGYNEIMFEDAQGKELVNIQAERNLNELVKHDASVTVKNDRTTTIWTNDSTTVGKQHKLTIAAPGHGAPAPGPTSVTMVHDKITLTTGEGKASITLEKGNITLSASGTIIIAAAKSIGVHSANESVSISAKKVVQIDGDEAVLINCTKPPPKPIEAGGPSALGILGTVALGVGVAAAIISAPVLAGVVIGAAVLYGSLSH